MAINSPARADSIPGVTPGEVLSTPSRTAQRIAAQSLRPVAIVAGIAALVGSFLAWMSVVTVLGTVNYSGFDTKDGKITAAAAIATVALGYFGLAMRSRRTVIFGVLAAVGGLAYSLYALNDVNDLIRYVNTDPEATASVGNGLYLCIVGFAICGCALFGALLSANRRPLPIC